MHFEMPFKMHKIIFFPVKKLKKKKKKIGALGLRNIFRPNFRPVAQNTLIFLFGLMLAATLSYADYICKQVGPRSELTECLSKPDSKPLDTERFF